MDFNLVNLWHVASVPGKAVIVILALMGLYQFAIGVERLIVFRRAKQRSIDFVYGLQKKLQDKAAELKAANPPADPKVIEAADKAVKEFPADAAAAKAETNQVRTQFDDYLGKTYHPYLELRVAELVRNYSGPAGTLRTQVNAWLEKNGPNALGQTYAIVRSCARSSRTSGGNSTGRSREPRRARARPVCAATCSWPSTTGPTPRRN